MRIVGGVVLALAAGCQGGPTGKVEPFECTAKVNKEVETILDVRWSTELEATAWIEFGLTDSYERGRSPVFEATTEHDLPIYGFPEQTTVFFKAHETIGEQEYECVGSAKTGQLPPTLQRNTEVTVNDASSYDEPFILVSQVGSLYKHLTVYDRDGNIVWYMLGDPENSTVDAWLDPTNRRLLYMWQSLTFRTDVGMVGVTNWVHEPLDSFRTEEAHHVMEVRDDSSLVSYLALDVRNVDMADMGTVAVAGDRLMELDLETGNTEQIYSVWDDFTPTYSARWDIVTYPGIKDWTHANGAHYYPASDTYLLSLANIDTIVELSRTTGDIVDTITNKSYTFDGKSEVFKFQHDPRWGVDEKGATTLSLSSTTAGVTVDLIYAVDRANRTLTETWQNGRGDDIFAFALGENIPLDNGNRLCDFGSAGVLREVGLDGTVVWELRGSKAGTVAFSGAKVFSDFYTME